MDIKITCFLIELGCKLFSEFNYKWLAKDIKTNLPLEIDFLNEIKHSDSIKSLLKLNNVKIPHFHRKYSSKRVLVMDFIEGYSITDVEKIKRDNIDISHIAKTMAKLFNQMIFEYGIFHADPHPGNIYIQKLEGENNYNIVLLDHGLYKKLSKDT